MARYVGAAWRSYKPQAIGPARTRGAVRSTADADGLILGLDPGSQRTGFGLIESRAGRERHVDSGCISVGSGELSGRLRAIYERVSLLVDRYRPDAIAVERVFVHRNPATALVLGQARGAAICAAVAAGARMHEYAPRAIKLAITGYGAAVKPQIGHMVRVLLALAEEPGADQADALAVALCHAHARRLSLLGLCDAG